MRAAAELEAIVAYIAQFSPQNSARMGNRLLNAIASLDILPKRYPLLETGRLAGEIRSMPLRPYLIRYRVDE